MNSITSIRRSLGLKIILTIVPILIMTVGVIVGVMNINTIRHFFIGAEGEPANIQIDVMGILGPMPRPWRNLAQGGESADWQLTPLVSQVRALNPEYIRIDHLYDFYVNVSRGGDNSLQYDWTKLDEMVKQIQATGAKPYISLSYMPTTLAVDGQIIGAPSNWAEYQQVMYRTISHLSKELAIDDVIYEVWNEPDLFGGWKYGGKKNYLQLYGAAARAAEQVRASGSKSFKIGGPATTDLYFNWIAAILKYAHDNGLPLDFLSWHRYVRNVEQYRIDFADIQNQLAAYPEFTGIELHITEWGHNSDVDAGYDGNYGAIHTAAVATEMVGIVNRAFVFEIQDGKSPEGKEYWGRWGLFTHGDFGAKAKPRYRALRFIDQIGDQRMSILGKGTWVKGMAAKKDDAVQVILVNFDHAGSHSETVPVTFRNIEPGTFTVEQQYFDGRVNSFEVATTSAELQITVPMSPNSMVSILLK